MDAVRRLTCDRPPEGWYCTREPEHAGPCAAWPVEESPDDADFPSHVGEANAYMLGWRAGARAARPSYRKQLRALLMRIFNR